MESANNTLRRENVVRASDVTVRNYKHDIQLYKIAIKGTMNLEDLKKLGEARLSILRTVEETANQDRGPDKCLANLVAGLRKLGFASFANLFDGSLRNSDEKGRRWARWRDHVSYYATSLALSQNQETKQWLQEGEERLMKWRLTALNDQEITDFMEINNLRYPTVGEKEKMYVKDKLTATMEAPERFSETIFHKVPFLEELALLKNQRVHVTAGVAYLTTSQLRFVILDRYERHLEMQLKELKGKHLATDDPRPNDLVIHLQRVHSVSKRIGWNPRMISVKDLDRLSVTSFPPCMRKLHEALRLRHHLRNDGRVQYTLFLKAIGLPFESALEFFREEFTKKIDDNAFNKEYAYVVKHLYGLVGGKRNYASLSCSKIAEKPVGNDEYHGCPFTIGDIEDLGKMLTRWNIRPNSKAEIVQLTMEDKVGQACSACFEAAHGCVVNRPIVDPTDYYRESKKLHDSGYVIPTMESDESDEEDGESDASITEIFNTPGNRMDVDTATGEGSNVK